MSRPPTPGPSRNATPYEVSWIPLARSRVIPAARAVSGSIVVRAVMPAGSNTAPRTATAASSPRFSPTVMASTGTIATLTIDSRSLPTATRRRPSMSIRVPLNSIDTSSGSDAAAAIRATAVASPPDSSTSHGNATSVMPFAVPDRTVVTSRVTNGRRRLTTDRCSAGRTASA